MLSPKELGEAGDAVAAVYAQMEAEMLDHLVSSLVNGSITDKTLLELNLLAQANKRAVEQIIESYRDQIGEAVVQTVEEYIGKSDADDARRIGSSEMAAPRQIVATVAGIQEILDRDNLAMAQGARDAFLQSSIEAVTKVNSGLCTDSKAIHAAVRKLEGDGIDIITYRNAETGVVTVRNKVDVAVRRHVRTQIAQDAARMSLERMDELEVKLVEVSSHDDARPSHAEWQGRCYSLQGAIKIGATTYPDFYEATRYGSVDGLAGANCRHSFGPYVHGAPRTYSPNPKSPTGLSGQELYELEQKQRHGERQIRAAKRQLRGAQAEYDADPTLANQANLLKAQKALRGRQESMRNLIDSANAKCKPGTHALSRNPRREWAGDMPKITKVSASQRSVSQFLDSKSVKAQMKSAGISKTRMRAEIASEMAKRGCTSKDFAALTAQEQQSLFGKIKDAIDSKLPSTKKAQRGAHAVTLKRYVQGLEAKGLQPSHAQGIAQRVAACSSANARRVFERALPDLGFDRIAGNPQDAFYSPSTRRLTLDMKTTADGFAARPDKAPYQTFFHEAGHYIDHLLGNFETGVVKAGRYRIQNMSGAAYQAGMATVAKQEVRSMLNEIKKRDGCTTDEAKRTLTKELRTIPAKDRGGLPDIVHGATAGKSGWGHTLKYWRESKDYGLAAETFAHFYETTMANPTALETLKKYLPETYNLFTSIIGGS